MSLRLALNLQQPHVGLKVLWLQLCTTVPDQRNGETFGVKLFCFFKASFSTFLTTFHGHPHPPMAPCIVYICTLHLWAHVWVFCRGSRVIILHLIEEGGRNQIQSSLIWPVFLMYTGDLPACMSKRHIHTVPMETRRGGTPGPGVSIVSCH